MTETASDKSVRLDKWLWAARFFKTRAMAKQAIEGGKVHCEGVRAKPGKEVQIGLILTLRQGFDNVTVVVKQLSDQRRGAPQARLLYEETSESQRSRELAALQRRNQPRQLVPDGRPNKRERRQLNRFKHQDSD